MTVKFTNGENVEITEAHKVRSDPQPDGGFEVSIYAASGERTGRYLVKEASGQFTRAYVMDAGKTIEVVKQVTA
jgi:hypothetical protein